MKSVTLNVEGISCGHCVNSIEGGLKEIGITGIVNLESKSVDVKYDENETSLEIVKKTIEDLGYEVI